MGSNIHLKQQAIILRKKGKSYNDIIKVLGIKSKGTLSHWFRGINLSSDEEKLLKTNNELAHKRGLFNANKIRTKRITEENSESLGIGKGLIQSISNDKLLLIGASLYWAEGTKSINSSPTLTFSNSDPDMISVYMRFVREILKVPEEKIRAGIHIYPSISPEFAKKFWARITGLPEDRFYIITQISRASQGKRPFNILPYGTLAIKVNNRIQFYKVKGMINGIIQKLT
jgi:hypothetical protein